jgi:hypothetical protein
MSDLNPWGSSQKIIVKAGTTRVSVVKSGPAGPPGPQGPAGASGEGAVFEFTQVAPSSSWVINHNLGVYPIYNVIEAGTEAILEPGEIHHSLNQLELTFLTPRAGVARVRS